MRAKINNCKTALYFSNNADPSRFRDFLYSPVNSHEVWVTVGHKLPKFATVFTLDEK